MANNEGISKYLQAARRAREENNAEEAKKYYDMVRTDDPDCVEARFFYVYYTMMSGKKIEVYGLFNRVLESMLPAVKGIASSDMSEEEKGKLLVDIWAAYKPLPVFVNRALNDLNKGTDGLYSKEIRSAGKNGMTMFYEFGDEVAKQFADSKAIVETVAVDAWKEGVAQQQKWYGMGVDKTFPETYTAKIQKYDATYTMPKKGGCIQFN